MASSPQPGEKRKAEEISSDAPLDNIVNIDPDGDLVLVVGADLVGSDATLFNVEKAVTFRVDYKALARTSLVFKAKFDTKRDDYKPGTSEVGWTEHLPQDSPSGLNFLFLIAHAKLNKVPEQQSFQEIYEIVEMTVRYDMFPLLKGRAKLWFSGGVFSSVMLCGGMFSTSRFSDIIAPNADAKTLSQTLGIGQGLGKQSMMIAVVNHIATHSQINNGQLYVNGENLEDGKFCFTQVQIQLCKYQRLTALRAISREMGGFIQQLLGTKAFGASEKCPNHQSQNVEGQICESIALGSLMKALAKRREWPLPEPEHKDTWSVNSLEQEWSAIKLRGFSDTIQKRPKKECDWASELRSRVEMAAQMNIGVDQGFAATLKQRASLVGL
ncbi:hypothetical protein PG993_015225 [Apiospora rasikravindrae]|uniref:BTB domain-containing protein n=1 Tax=Apiospora rasikravindrae TaxID=990691 RepID=A0ABR1RPY8_9PEZI